VGGGHCPPGDEGEQAKIGGGIVEVFVANRVAQSVDRRGQHEDVHDRVNAGGKQTPANSDNPAQSDGADYESREPVVEQGAVPDVFFDVAGVAFEDILI